jgi:dynein heavy chain, axonemal
MLSGTWLFHLPPSAALPLCIGGILPSLVQNWAHASNVEAIVDLSSAAHLSITQSQLMARRVQVDETLSQLLDDNIVMTQAMSFSPYKKPYEERIAKWEAQLSLVSEILDGWLAVQRNWMYLEPIFSSADIMEQLPLEGKRFATVDRTWRKVLEATQRVPLILKACSSQKLLDTFLDCNKLLDSVQKGLANYLETKRLAFARFFFLSNDELLQILSQTKDPLAVQPHLRKCFEAIERLSFAPDLQISAMQSKEGEVMPFDKPMYPMVRPLVHAVSSEA